MPFLAQEPASFSVSLGAGAVAQETPKSTIPNSWTASVNELLELYSGKLVVAMVVGGVDSGKSSFCTYLTNCLVSAKRRVAVLDEDLGQSDVGPPCTVAYAYVARPVTDLLTLNPKASALSAAVHPPA